MQLYSEVVPSSIELLHLGLRVAWRLHVSSKPLLSKPAQPKTSAEPDLRNPSSGYRESNHLKFRLSNTMANQTKQYFLAPSWDYPPNGPIALGNIIVSPSRPVPALVTAASADGSEGLISSTKQGVEWQNGKTNAHRFGIWTKLLVAPSLLPFLSLKSFAMHRQSIKACVIRASLVQGRTLCTGSVHQT